MSKKPKQAQVNFSPMEVMYKNIEDILTPVKFIKNNKGIEYANVSCSIDIETSSFYYNSYGETRKDQPLIQKGKNKIPDPDWKKGGCMYMYGIGINGKVVIKRTYDDLKSDINKIAKYYDLSDNKRMVFFIHNLSYEFQWFRKHFNWTKIFAIEERKPIYAIMDNGIELRCSYLLTGYRLEKLGDQLTKYKVKKLVGSLDYSLIRTPYTPINDEEYHYLINDNLVVMCYIQEMMERLGNILKFCITKTGFVRKLVKNACFYEDKSHRTNKYKYLNYRDFISNLTITSVAMYKQLKRGFQGGYTHANSWYVGKVMENLGSFDFTSSYPYCAISEEYPMDSGKIVEIHSKEELEKYLKCYCCLFDVTFYDLKSKLDFEHYLSISKCKIDGDYYNDNGRVVNADILSTTLTEQDYMIIKKTYKWSKCEYKNFRVFKKDYLPKDIILTILNEYGNKTKLKGIEGKEVEYQVSKENVNSIYGMMVTDIARDQFTYESDNWGIDHPDLKEELEKYNNHKQRFLYYAWGVWITAYARKNLWTGILEFKNDYVYSDTDSIKCLNVPDHMDYINKYNDIVINKLKKMCNKLDIDFDLCKPKTIKGDEKMLGLWDFEGDPDTLISYKKFKTLGAKRYLYIYPSGDLSFTISGLNKRVCVPYLKDLYKNDYDKIFEIFKDDMYIPKGKTGKMVHTYIDDPIDIEITDYTGIRARINELSFIHLEDSDSTLSISSGFLEYLKSFRVDLFN